MGDQLKVHSAATLVTGSGGFVGRHFCERYGGSPLADSQGTVDLRDAGRVQRAVLAQSSNAVLHLAAQSSVASSFQDPLETFAVNFHGTLNLLQALKEANFQGVFVYVGSADVYGHVTETELPARETQPLRPRSPYAVSKCAAEALCYQWSLSSPFRIVIARPFNQIGPGQDARFAIADFAHQIDEMRKGKRKPVLITGDIDVTRDFMDVRDTVRAYHLLMEHGENGEIYNICSGTERSIRSLLNELVQIADVQVELQVDQSRIRATEQRRMVGDPSKIGKSLGWYPERTMHQTLEDILRERGILNAH